MRPPTIGGRRRRSLISSSRCAPCRGPNRAVTMSRSMKCDGFWTRIRPRAWRGRIAPVRAYRRARCAAAAPASVRLRCGRARRTASMVASPTTCSNGCSPAARARSRKPVRSAGVKFSRPRHAYPRDPLRARPPGGSGSSSFTPRCRQRRRVQARSVTDPCPPHDTMVGRDGIERGRRGLRIVQHGRPDLAEDPSTLRRLGDRQPFSTVRGSPLACGRAEPRAGLQDP
jgi:hypothetical protein